MKIIVYVIHLKSKEDNLLYVMNSSDGKKLFTELNEAENILEKNGYEKLANSGDDKQVVSRFVNINYKNPQDRTSYFDVPRAEIIKTECEFEKTE